MAGQKQRRRGKTTPRIFTPPLRELTKDTSAGYSVIWFAEEILEIELYPWQRWLLIHALELLPDGSFRFDRVVVLVGRQNGKSVIGQVLALWMLYVRMAALVVGTAQDLTVASEMWKLTVDLAESVPDLHEEFAREPIRQVNREVLVLDGDRRYMVRAATRKGGRGLSGDLILLDELREHQTWQAWSALTKTTMARRLSLIWCMSNAGDITSVVLRYLRMMAHAALGDPDGITVDKLTGRPMIPEPPPVDEDDEYEQEEPKELGIFEWSAPPGCSIWDRDGWAQSNPALGYGNNTEAKIAASAAGDPEWEFRTEVMCQWSEGTLKGPFGAGKWEAGLTTEAPPKGTPYMLGLAVSKTRSQTHVVAAYRNAIGLPQLSLEASRPGTDWTVEWARATGKRHLERYGMPLKIAIQERGAPGSSLIPDLDDLRADPDDPGSAVVVEVVRWGGPELANATAMMYDLVDASEHDPARNFRTGLCHMPAPALDLAAATAVPKMLDGGGMVWDDKRSPADAGPLLAGTAALWLLLRPAEERRRSAYDEGATLTMLD